MLASAAGLQQADVHQHSPRAVLLHAGPDEPADEANQDSATSLSRLAGRVLAGASSSLERMRSLTPRPSLKGLFPGGATPHAGEQGTACLDVVVPGWLKAQLWASAIPAACCRVVAMHGLHAYGMGECGSC